MHSVLPGLPSFDYISPDTLADASSFLAENQEDARPFMGGTDIFVRIRDGVFSYKYLVDVKRLDGMGEIHFNPNAGLTLGAAVDMNRVIRSEEVRTHYPVLAEAASRVASYQLRTRATIAGNICNASPAGDTIGACLLLDAALQIHGTDGAFKIPLSEFFQGPGQTVLKPGDIVTSINFPFPHAGMASKYLKLGRNQLSDLAIVGVTAVGYPDEDLSSGYRMRLALASVAPIPLVVAEVEDHLAKETITEKQIDEAARIAENACSPISDVRGGAQYRKLMVRNLSRRALRYIWDELNR